MGYNHIIIIMVAAFFRGIGVHLGQTLKSQRSNALETNQYLIPKQAHPSVTTTLFQKKTDSDNILIKHHVAC